MNKAYNRINWVNYPATDTALNALNLNLMDSGLNEIDNRVVSLDTTKANQSDMYQAVRNISLDKPSGVLTVTFFNGSSATINTGIEKIAINFTYDSDPESPNYQKIIIHLEDGTVELVDLTSLISQYEFDASSTIQPTVTAGRISLDIIDGSVTGAKLETNYLANITVKSEEAASSATSSEGSAVTSESWAQGGTGTREGEDTNNSKHYAEVAQETVASLLAAFGISVIGERLVFGANFEEQYDVEVQNSTLIITERVPNT